MSEMVSEASGTLKLKDLCRELNHCCCSYGNIALTFSLTEPDAAYLARAGRAIARLARDYPRGLGMLVLIDGAARPPSEASRVAIKQSFLSMSGIMLCGVQVVEGHGFMASAKRSVLTLINMTSGFPFPVKVAGTVLEAVPLLMKIMGPTIDPRVGGAGLATAAVLMRSRFTSQIG